MSDDEVEKLAESLKNSGLAASMMDARNKAMEILGHPDKNVKIRVDEPQPEHIKNVKFLKTSEKIKSKVDDIIKEVDEEIKVKAEEHINFDSPEKDFSKFDDPSFNIADSGMNINELTSDEIMTNDPSILDKEKEGDSIEQPEDSSPHMIMTNDELNQKNIEEQSKTFNDFGSQEFSEEEEGDSHIQIEDKKKPKLTEEEKEMSDLSKLFNYGKR
jgi:hypothetical protein